MTRVRSPWLVLSALCLGQSVVLLDTTVVNVAIPSIIDGVGATLNQVLWVISGYLLPYAILLVTAGRLGDLYGPKRLFLGGLALFTLASAACGLAQDPTQLIAARVVQGVGAALLTPQSLSMISHVFPPERRGTALGIWGAVGGIVAAAGPTLGGLIVASLGWRWIFYVNMPVGVVGIVLAATVLPNLSSRRHRLDLLGTVLLTSALFLIAYGLIEGEPRHWGAVWGPITVPTLIVTGAAILAIFVAVERVRQDREPLLPFGILRDRNFTLMSFVVVSLPCGLSAMLLLTLIYMQSGLGMTALEAGLTVAAAPLVSILFAPTSGRLTDRYGGKYVLIVGLVLFAAGLACLAAVADVDSTWRDLLPGLMVIGIAMGVVFSPASVLAMRDIDLSMTGAASGVFNMTRLSGGMLGGAAVGALLQARLTASVAESTRVQAGTLPPGVRDQFVDSVTRASGGGLEVGVTQPVVPVDGVPEPVTAAFLQAAERVFHEGLTNAVRVTYLLPIAILLVAALATLAVNQRRTVAVAKPPAEPQLPPVTQLSAVPGD